MLLSGAPSMANQQSTTSQPGPAQNSSIPDAKLRQIERFPKNAEPETESRGRSVPKGSLEQLTGLVSSNVKQAIAIEEWQLAAKRIRADFANSEPGTGLSPPRYYFLLGYLAFQNEHFEKAFNYFSRADDRLPLLEGYLDYFAAKSAFELDSHHRAFMLAADVRQGHRFYESSLLLLARSLILLGEQSDLERAKTLLQDFISEYDGVYSFLVARARYWLGRAYQAEGYMSQAARSYLECIENHPVTAPASRAERRFKGLLNSLGVGSRPSLQKLKADPEFIMQKAKTLYSSHNSRRVISLLKDNLARLAKKQQLQCEARYYIGKSYRKLRDRNNAIYWYDELLDNCSRTKDQLRGLYLKGKSHWNLDQGNKARSAWRTLWTRYPEHSYADDSLFFAARSLFEEDEPDRALALLRKQLKRYPEGDMAPGAHWLIVQKHLEQDAYKKVVEYIEGLDREISGDLYTNGRLEYFKGRALEQLDRAGEAATLYRRLIENHILTYYGLMAFNRLARIEAEQKQLPDDLCEAVGDYCKSLETAGESISVSDELKKRSEFKRGILLAGLGLSGLAETEFQSLFDKASYEASTLWQLALLLDTAQSYHLSHEVPRRRIPNWDSYYPTASELPRKWQIAYPRPYRDRVKKHGSEYGVPTELIYAIMREESAFKVNVRSWANARGLLQLMKSTAAGVANREGIQYGGPRDLFEIDTNIELGTAYLGQLDEKLGGQVPLMIPGYNAGSSNARAWLEDQSKPKVLDRWIEAIPFGQTRRYAKRVLRSYWVYSWLYGDNQTPALNFDLKDIEY